MESVLQEIRKMIRNGVKENYVISRRGWVSKVNKPKAVTGQLGAVVLVLVRARVVCTPRLGTAREDDNASTRLMDAYGDDR